MKTARAVTPELLQAFETVPDLYLILSPDLVILTASDAYLKATFKEREDIKGKTMFQAFPDNPALPASDATANLRSSLNYVLSHKQPHQMALQRYDVMLPEQSGLFTEKYWLPTNTPVLDQEGAVLYIIHKAVDVTEQQQAVQQLETLRRDSDRRINASEEREKVALAQTKHHHELLLAILEQAPVAISLFQGVEQVIATANSAMCRIWGRSPEQVLGKPLLEALPELVGQEYDTLVQQVYMTGVPFEGKEHPAQLLRHGKLETNYFNFACLPLYNDQGELLGVLDVAVEVTELVLARKRVEQSEAQLQLLNQDLAAANEEIRASNEEFLAANEQLLYTQHVLEHLNQELEERVAARTRDLQEAKAQTETERNRLHHLFMQAPAPIVVLDGPELVLEVVNPAYQQIFPGREMQGKPVLEALPELKGAPIFDILNQVYETGETFVAREMPMMLVRHQGAPPEKMYFTFTYQARQNQNGIVDGVLAFAHEVTDQVLARQRIAESEEKYRSLFQTMDQGFCIIEMIFDAENKPVDYRFLEYNQMFEQHTGLKGAAGKTVRELVPELEPHWYDIYGKVALTGEPIRFTQGSEAMGRWFEVYAFRLGGDQSRKVSLLFSDITHRKQTEEALLQSEERLSRVVEGSNDGIWDWDFVEDKAWWNQRYTEILGVDMPYAERGLRSITEFIHPEDRHLVPEALKAHVERGEKYELEYRIIRPSGEIRHVQAKGKAVTDRQGRIAKLSGVITDITERKQAEENLRVKHDELIRINNDLDNFIYTASHDLKSPILNIEGLLEALLSDLPPETVALPPVQGITAMMQESVERFKKTIAHLTEVVKLQKDNSRAAVLVDVGEVIGEVLLDLKQEIQSSGARIDEDVADCPAIRFSEKNLRSVVYNLLSNALKYRSPEREPRVRVHCQATAGFLVLSVQDNGLGMDTATTDKLFTMFKRFHSHVEGSGIGLYMIKKMIDNADGRIGVESQLGEGSTFRVYFPR